MLKLEIQNNIKKEGNRLKGFTQLKPKVSSKKKLLYFYYRSFLCLCLCFNRFVCYKVPRFACSRSMLSNKALKLPAPNPLAPIRCIISKNRVGRSSNGFVNICNK